MAIARYRFFPHVRRGLTAAITDPATAAPRAKTRLRLSVTPEIATEREASLIGPGDVLGIDRRLIVRTEPRANARAVEPNYLAAIEFDLPDFPWMFTPFAPDAKGRVPPWLVLVVLDLQAVGQPQVKANRPLPFVTLPGALPQTELPDLADSWAWAHAQRIDLGEGDDAAALAAAPERNVSRLICPRRLSPGRRWLACLVPAFDLGVQAGLGAPVADVGVQPAWTSASEDLELPLYHHWVFETGSDGDFEKLASRLKPHKAVSAPGALAIETARRARAWLGAADASIALASALPATDTNSALRMDAPLETLDRDDPTPGEVPAVVTAAIAAALTPGDPDAPDAELLPPVHGGRHARREQVDPARAAADWLDELNLDPRTRTAARTGGDVVRGHQEDLMQTAWEQVGDVLAANAQLDRSRFMAAVAARGFERHLAKLAPTRLLAVTAALHARTRIGADTLAMMVARTSLADRAFDAALRRMSGDGARAARSMNRFARGVERVSLVAAIGPALQKDAAIVDPTVRERDGIGMLRVIEAAAGRLAPDLVLAVQGTPIGTMRALSDAVPVLDDRLEPRADLAEALFTDRHRREATVLAAQTGDSAERILQLAKRAAVDAPGGATLVLRKQNGTLRVQPLVRERSGLVAIVEGGTMRPLFKLDAGDDDARIDSSTLVTLAASMPRDLARGEDLSAMVRVRDGVTELSFARLTVEAGGTAATRARRRANALRDVANSRRWSRLGEIRGDTDSGLSGLVGTIASPAKGVQIANAVRGALADLAHSRPAAVADPVLVRADLGASNGGLAAGVKAAIQPARTFRNRASALVSTAAWLPPRADLLLPIMAVPDYQVAVAAMLARTAPHAFLPRDVVIPPESITALRTNPRWVAACMVGANHELNRELAWRTYPTDGRGTPLGRFWDWFDPDRADVAAIHAWPRGGPLASRLVGGGTSNIVFAVRGALLQRYPNTLLFAWKADGPEKLAQVPDDAAGRRAVLREAQFRGVVPPDLVLVGFDLTPAEFRTGWFLVLQEPLSESRFGLDEEGTQGGSPRNVNGRSWAGMGVAQGGHLRAATLDGSDGFTSAGAANLLLQRPVRVAIHSDQLTSALD